MALYGPPDTHPTIVFFGGADSVTAAMIATSTNSPLSHVGIEFTVERRETIHTANCGVIVIPPGRYLLHASRDDYLDSIGPCKQGVIITPAHTVRDAYPVTIDVWHMSDELNREQHRRLMISFIVQRYGDAYGMRDLFNPVNIVSGDYPQNRPVCSSLVVYWMSHVGYHDDCTFDSPAGLYRYLLRTNKYATTHVEEPRLPVDIIVLMFLVFATLVVLGLMSTYRRRAL